MSFYNGILNLTNWSGNVILPTLAGLFIAIAIIQFSKGKEYSYAMYGGFMCLMASGLLRAFETFASQRAWNDPNLVWASVASFVDWICNVLLPIYAALQVAAGRITTGRSNQPAPADLMDAALRRRGTVPAGVGIASARRVLRNPRNGGSDLMGGNHGA